MTKNRIFFYHLFFAFFISVNALSEGVNKRSHFVSKLRALSSETYLRTTKQNQQKRTEQGAISNIYR